MPSDKSKKYRVKFQSLFFDVNLQIEAIEDLLIQFGWQFAMVTRRRMTIPHRFCYLIFTH
jgi:hypothetical protein